MVRGRIRQELQYLVRGHRLAGARLADQRHRFALAQVERDAIDRERVAPALAEGDGEVLDLEQFLVGGVHRVHIKVFRGSKASRTASPMKIKSDSMTASVRKPENPSHG